MDGFPYRMKNNFNVKNLVARIFNIVLSIFRFDSVNNPTPLTKFLPLENKIA